MKARAFFFIDEALVAQECLFGVLNIPGLIFAETAKLLGSISIYPLLSRRSATSDRNNQNRKCSYS